jgi:hypothetical protein
MKKKLEAEPATTTTYLKTYLSPQTTAMHNIVEIIK